MNFLRFARLWDIAFNKRYSWRISPIKICDNNFITQTTTKNPCVQYDIMLNTNGEYCFSSFHTDTSVSGTIKSLSYYTKFDIRKKEKVVIFGRMMGI